MSTKVHIKTDLVSGTTLWAEQTTSYHAIPNLYWGKKWFRRPTYHIIFTYLISQAKYVPTDQLEVGQCSVGTIELAKFFNMPRSTVNDILHFLENEGEITLHSTNKYTIITVNYLSKSPTSKTQKTDIKKRKVRHQKTVISVSDSTSYENEGVKVRHQNTKSPTSKHEISDTPIDDTINDIINESNEINFVKKSNELIFEEENIMSIKDDPEILKHFVNDTIRSEDNGVSAGIKKDKSIKSSSLGNSTAPKPISKPNFIDKVLNIWTEEYLLNRNIEYIVMKGKDTGAISKLLAVFKKQKPELDTPDMLEYFRLFFKQVLAIEDKFIHDNVNLMFIYSQINKINSILASQKIYKSYSSVGQTQAGGNYYLPLK